LTVDFEGVTVGEPHKNACLRACKHWKFISDFRYMSRCLFDRHVTLSTKSSQTPAMLKEHYNSNLYVPPFATDALDVATFKFVPDFNIQAIPKEEECKRELETAVQLYFRDAADFYQADADACAKVCHEKWKKVHKFGMALCLAERGVTLNEHGMFQNKKSARETVSNHPEYGYVSPAMVKV